MRTSRAGAFVLQQEWAVIAALLPTPAGQTVLDVQLARAQADQLVCADAPSAIWRTPFDGVIGERFIHHNSAVDVFLAGVQPRGSSRKLDDNPRAKR